MEQEVDCMQGREESGDRGRRGGDREGRGRDRGVGEKGRDWIVEREKGAGEERVKKKGCVGNKRGIRGEREGRE